MKKFAVLVLSAGAAAVLAAPVASAAPAVNTQSHFHLAYGASVVDGDITWSNRSVHISGTVTARSATRQAEFIGYNGNVSCSFDETRTAAVNTTKPYGFDESCNFPGGFSEVDVFLNDESGYAVRYQDIPRP